jgi:hypothetical protein
MTSPLRMVARNALIGFGLGLCVALVLSYGPGLVGGG